MPKNQHVQGHTASRATRLALDTLSPGSQDLVADSEWWATPTNRAPRERNGQLSLGSMSCSKSEDMERSLSSDVLFMSNGRIEQKVARQVELHLK